MKEEMTPTEKKVADHVMGEIRRKIPGAVLHECGLSFDCDDHYSVSIGVKPGGVLAAYEKFRGMGGTFKVPVDGEVVTASMTFEPIMPSLVQAKLGDWVLIYRKWQDEPDWSVGKVTSIRTGASGERAYGVRYVHEAVKVHMGGVDVFEVSEEDYGGLQSGFAAVLTEKEALDRIEGQVQERVDRYSKKLKECVSNLRGDIQRKTRFKNLVKIQRIQAEPMRIVDPQE